jgi:hypothetical protein
MVTHRPPTRRFSGTGSEANFPGSFPPGGVVGVRMRARPSTMRTPRKASGRPFCSWPVRTGWPPASTAMIWNTFHSPFGCCASRRSGRRISTWSNSMGPVER